MVRTKTWLSVPVALTAAVLAACAGGQAPSAPSTLAPAAAAAAPQVVIESPPGNAQVVSGLPVDVVTTAVDPIGVGRIDLVVDGSTVSSAEAPPGGLTSFSAVHLWVPATEGVVTLAAIAYRTDGAPSAPMTISVLVLASGSAAVPYPTVEGAIPTYRAHAVSSSYPPPTYAAKPTYAVNATYAADPTHGAHPTYAADPTGYQAQPTATYVAEATPTYTATATTAAEPTTAPTAAATTQTLAWKVPYKSTNQISDSVRYPGDIDRVNYEVTGMNSYFPGNTAHLTVTATCAGSGFENVRFLVGQAKFTCGQTVISNLFITNESNTGSIRATVIGTSPVNITWTLTGQATQ